MSAATVTRFWYASPMLRHSLHLPGKTLCCIVVMSLCLTATAQQAAGSRPAATDPPATGGSPTVTPGAGAAAGSNVLPPQDESSQYLIGPGDQLRVFVWRNEDLTVTVPVRPDGKISTPLVENMVAVGKTPSQLARDMEAVLSEYVRSPKVNIIVTQPVSTLSQVKVIGQVAHPQAIPYREGMTVLDVVLQSGGLGPFAAGNRARIIRTENGKTRELPVKIVKLQAGEMQWNLPLKPGDVLVVPQALF